MEPKIIGREKELRLIQQCVSSDKAEFVAIYGRRRIGKTYLVRQYFADKFDFYATGIYQGSMKDQLRNFGEQLMMKSNRFISIPKDWHEAFMMLREYLSSLRKKKIVIFLDELPWFDTARSKFVQELPEFGIRNST